MRILLIGGRSYVGQSLISIHDADIDWIPISRHDLDFPSFEKQAENTDAIVVIATPAMSTVGSEWTLDETVRQFLIENSASKICISSIRAEDEPNDENKNYISALREFETHAATHSWQVLRISNFLGASPIGFPSQERLLPWALLSPIASEDTLSLKSAAEQLTEWVDAEDVCEALKTITRSNYSGKFVTRPSFEISLGEMINLMADYFRSSDHPLNVVYGSSNRPRRMTTADERLSRLGWSTKVTTEVLLETLIRYREQKSIEGGS